MVVTSGSSMTPLIEPGSELIIDWHPKAFALGDVVVFINQYHRFVAHRIVAVDSAQRRKRYLIKGDNTRHDDGWFDERQLVGKVSTIVRGGNAVDEDS
ncbi:S24/S26 family peptidase [Candidatus Gottesmanbacteria bacterium]|nr:S24/S26 family peptidase [Candidatus Gottesmanbacteria bacterium]